MFCNYVHIFKGQCKLEYDHNFDHEFNYFEETKNEKQLEIKFKEEDDKLNA